MPDGDVSAPRLTVLEFVRRTPGCIIGEVASELGISRTTAAHHLAALERLSWIMRERQGRAVMHFARGQARPSDRLLPFLLDPRSRSIVEHFVQWPAGQWTVNSLANEVGCYHGFLLRCLRALEKNGFVQIDRPRGRYYVAPTSRLLELAPSVLATIGAPGPSAESGS